MSHEPEVPGLARMQQGPGRVPVPVLEMMCSREQAERLDIARRNYGWSEADVLLSEDLRSGSGIGGFFFR